MQTRDLAFYKRKCQQLVGAILFPHNQYIIDATKSGILLNTSIYPWNGSHASVIDQDIRACRLLLQSPDGQASPVSLAFFTFSWRKALAKVFEIRASTNVTVSCTKDYRYCSLFVFSWLSGGIRLLGKAKLRRLDCIQSAKKKGCVSSR